MTEFNAVDGSWVATLSCASYGIKGPAGIAFDGTNMWAANGGGSNLTEFTVGGTVVRMVSVGSPSSLAFDGSSMWVTQLNVQSVSKVDPANRVVRGLSGPEFEFSASQGIAFDGSRMWIANQGRNSVTEVPTGR